MNASQIQFVNLIIQYLTTNGVITAEKLFEPPFTEINSNGLLGLWGQTLAQEVVMLIEKIKQQGILVDKSPISY